MGQARRPDRPSLRKVSGPLLGRKQWGADEKIYLADSTENAVVIIDARTQAVEKVMNVGLFPWGTHIMDSKDNYCH